MDRAIPDPRLLFSAYSSAIPIYLPTQVSSDRRQVNIGAPQDHARHLSALTIAPCIDGLFSFAYGTAKFGFAGRLQNFFLHERRGSFVFHSSGSSH
jgi:hypothetical protein